MGDVDGGPAFPAEAVLHNKGMTLRDWFAGQALVGKLAHGEVGAAGVSRRAYEYADAMLAARSKEA